MSGLWQTTAWREPCGRNTSPTWTQISKLTQVRRERNLAQVLRGAISTQQTNGRASSLLCFLLYCWKVYFYILFPYWYCVDPVCLAVYERAVRNCPWSHTIWADYIRSLERFNKEHSVVVKVFEECLSVGFNEPGAYLEVGVWNVFSDLFSLNFIVLFLNTLKPVSKLVSKTVYTALKVLVFFY